MGVSLGSVAKRSVEVGELVILLALETATESVSVALHDGSDVVAFSEIRSDRQHAEALTPMIQHVCAQGRIELRDVGGIAVDVGPGLFTGMRVGIASAKALAHVLDVGVVEVSSVEAIARSVASDCEVVASVIDARRGEVFWSLNRMLDGALRQVGQVQVGSVDSCIADIADRGQSVVLAGTGVLCHRSDFVERLTGLVPTVEFASEDSAVPSAAHVARIGYERARREEWTAARDEAARYLRQPDAEINWSTRSS
jgi:tRNA threonylcarbamoyladenosine biosynthesis protein TsaB